MRNEPIRHVKYTLPNGKAVYLTNRPDWCDKASVVNFIADTIPTVRFCFCDDYSDTGISFDPEVPLVWFPWFTSTPVYPGNVFAFMSLMKKQISKPNGSIWCHCDFSSMRAPTHFGLFLLAEYGEEASIAIEKVYWEEEHRMKNMFGDPVGYAKASMEFDPNIKGLVEAWRTGGEEAANSFLQTISVRIS